MKSASLYDPMLLQEKVLKVAIGNNMTAKQLILRKAKHNMPANEKSHLREFIVEIARDWTKSENEHPKYEYNKKKLRVVKGRTRSYKMKSLGG